LRKREIQLTHLSYAVPAGGWRAVRSGSPARALRVAACSRARGRPARGARRDPPARRALLEAFLRSLSARPGQSAAPQGGTAQGRRGPRFPRGRALHPRGARAARDAPSPMLGKFTDTSSKNNLFDTRVLPVSSKVRRQIISYPRRLPNPSTGPSLQVQRYTQENVFNRALTLVEFSDCKSCAPGGCFYI